MHDPSPRFLLLWLPSLLSFLLIKTNRNPWCNFCISEIWDSDLFHSPVSIIVMFCKDSPFLNYHLLCRLFRRSNIFSRPGIWRSKGCSEVKGWSKSIIHSGPKFLHKLKSFTSFRPVLISFSDTRSPAENFCEALFGAANTFNKNHTSHPSNAKGWTLKALHTASPQTWV